jgi:hypothetical protein
MERVLAQKGERALMEREVRNFQQLMEAAKKVLNK